MVILQFNKLIRNKWVWGVFAIIVSLAFVAPDEWFRGGDEDRRGADGRNRLENVEMDDSLYDQCRMLSDGFLEKFPTRISMLFAGKTERDIWKMYAAVVTLRKAGFTIPDAVLAERVRSVFVGEDGSFSEDDYAVRVKNAFRVDVTTFESMVRLVMTLEFGLGNVIGTSAWPSSMEMDQSARDFTDRLTVQVATFTEDKETKEMKIDDKGLKSWFDENASSLSVPDRFKLRYVKFDADTSNVLARVKLSEEARDRLVTWIDFNTPYHGRWQTIVGKEALNREKLREERRALYTGVRQNHEDIETPAPVLKDTLSSKKKPKDGEPLKIAGWPFDPATKKAAPAPAIKLADGVEIALVAVPGGSFVMGRNEAKGPRDEHPAAQVDVKPFQIGAREITNREFRQFDPSHDSRHETRHGYQFGVTGYDVNGDDLPVVRVSWRKTVAFCDWLSKKTGRTVRLPTEAEWEWAARAGSGKPFWWGGVDDDFSAYANLADVSLSDYSGNPYVQDREKARYGNAENLFDNWVPQAHGVNDGAFLEEKSGKWKPNPWGLFDMHGNVWEWTQSKYLPYPYVADDGRNAPDGDERRVVRGGSWYSRPKLATASFRRAYRPYAPVYDVGFRIVVE